MSRSLKKEESGAPPTVVPGSDKFSPPRYFLLIRATLMLKSAMHYTNFLVYMSLNLGVLGAEFVSVTVTRTAIVKRDYASLCDLNPTDGTPPICNIDSSDSSSAPASSTTQMPSCELQDQDPHQGITSAYCVCNSKTLPLLSIATTAKVTEKCAYSSIPSTSFTAVEQSASTNFKNCEVCTPGAACTSAAGCYPQSATAIVQVGSSPVHVGTLTGTALYTSISSALEKLCPSVTQTKDPTVCATGSVSIKNIDYVDSSDRRDTGELVVKVQSSSYNETTLRDAMIRSAALTAQNSAAGNNCYNKTYVYEVDKRGGVYDWLSAPRDMSFTRRDHPNTAKGVIYLCNAAQFAGVQYFGQYWRAGPPGPTDYMDTTWEFTTGPGGNYICEFLEDLEAVLVAVAPEYAVGDVEVDADINALCVQALGSHGT